MPSNKELLAQQIAQAVGAGKAVALETVDFNDPNRPSTCLEVDFPILPVNQVAVIEGNAGKPIYQMSKWWARRRSSVFRSMLIAAAAKAPDDPAHAAKLVWDNYYANHQKKGAFKHLKVADIFMGGGTTLVEGSRLGMQMFGNDLNPVAWFVVKQEFANVDLDEVKRLLADIEAEVKPQIMPYYYCDGPNGEKGIWTHVPTGRVEGPDFDPLKLTIEQRREYKYKGPEIIYTFWAKHGPCQITGCGHRTPIMTTPVMAVKTLTVKHWEHRCSKCRTDFHVEEGAARIAPEAPLFVASDEYPYSVLDPKRGIVCPNCDHAAKVKLGKGKTKKVELSLLVHPQWLAGSAKNDEQGQAFGGSAQDDAESTARWNQERARKIRLLEVRGSLPLKVTCPDSAISFYTDARGGTASLKDDIDKKTKLVKLDAAGNPLKRAENSTFACGADGSKNDVLESVKASGKTAPIGAYAIQGYSAKADDNGQPYNGRFFAPFDERIALQYSAAQKDWDLLKATDLAPFWPKSELPYGFMTHHLQGGVPNHGYTHWWTMFNPRQLMVHALVFRFLDSAAERGYNQEAIDSVLATYVQVLRYHCMFAFYQADYDKMIPHFSNNNFHPKNNSVEGFLFSKVGAGNINAVRNWLQEGLQWGRSPWEIVSLENLAKAHRNLVAEVTGKSDKVFPGDPLLKATVLQGSSTELTQLTDNSLDLVVTDPPFGGLLHYSELSDFFYVWLHLVLKSKYPDIFGPEFTPKAMEVVSNCAREPEDPDGFYQRLLTQCWREANRILKPSGFWLSPFTTVRTTLGWQC